RDLALPLRECERLSTGREPQPAAVEVTFSDFDQLDVVLPQGACVLDECARAGGTDTGPELDDAGEDLYLGGPVGPAAGPGGAVKGLHLEPGQRLRTSPGRQVAGRSESGGVPQPHQRVETQQPQLTLEHRGRTPGEGLDRGEQGSRSLGIAARSGSEGL